MGAYLYIAAADQVCTSKQENYNVLDPSMQDHPNPYRLIEEFLLFDGENKMYETFQIIQLKT